MSSHSHINKQIKEYYKLFLDKTKAKYVRETLLAVSVAVILFGGYALHGWYRNYKNAQVFSGLLEVARAYDKAVEYQKKQAAVTSSEENTDQDNPWNDVDVMLDAASANAGGSSLSPFFLMYEAQMVLEQDRDFNKALELMEKGVRQFPSNSPFYHMFNLKRIKMALDSDNADVQKDALKDLKVVAEDVDNYCFEEAVYLLSLHYVHDNKMDEAIAAWKRLLANQPKNNAVQSPWVKQAEEKLKSLGISVEENK